MNYIDFMNWTVLSDEKQLEKINENSFGRPQLIFKHSISCPTSSLVKFRLEKSNVPAEIDFHYLDLINYRNISNKISDDYNVAHQSPQILLIKNGICVFNESHHHINMEVIEAYASK